MRLAWALLATLVSSAEICVFQYLTPNCGWLVQNETYTCGVCRNWSVYDPAPTILWPQFGAIANCSTGVQLYQEVNCTGTTTTSVLDFYALGECQSQGSVSWQFNDCANSEIGAYCVEVFSSTGSICTGSSTNTTRNCTDPCLADGSGSLDISCNNNAIASFGVAGCVGNSTALGAFGTCQSGAISDFKVHFGACPPPPPPATPFCLFRYVGSNCLVLNNTTGIANYTCAEEPVGPSLQSVFPYVGFYTYYANQSCVVISANYLYDWCYSFFGDSWILSSANCSSPIPPIITPTPVPSPTPVTPPPPTVCLYLYSDFGCAVPVTWFNLTCLGFCTDSPVLPVSAAHSCVTNTTILYSSASCLSSPYASAVNGTCQFYSSLFGTQSMRSIDGVCPELPVVTPTPTPTPPGLYCARLWGSLGCTGTLLNVSTGICQTCAYGNFLPNCGTGNVTTFFTNGCVGGPIGVGAFGTCIPTGTGSSVIFYDGSCPALPAPAPAPAPAPNTCGRFWNPSLTCGGPQLQDPVQNYCWNASSPGLSLNFFSSSTYNSFRIDCNTQLISFFTGSLCLGGSITSSFLIGNCFSFGSFALPMSTANTSCNLCSGVYFFLSGRERDLLFMLRLTFASALAAASSRTGCGLPGGLLWQCRLRCPHAG